MVNSRIIWSIQTNATDIAKVTKPKMLEIYTHAAHLPCSLFPAAAGQAISASPEALQASQQQAPKLSK